MNFNNNRRFFRFGYMTGVILAYTTSTLFLYIFFILTKKLPIGWNFINVATITLILSMAGILLKKWKQ